MKDQIASEYVEMRIRLPVPVQKPIVAALLGFRIPKKYFLHIKLIIFVPINGYCDHYHHFQQGHCRLRCRELISRIHERHLKF